MYCSQADLIKRYGEDELLLLTDDSGSGEVDSAQVEQAINDASALVDTYLGRYQLPLAQTPTVLNRLSADVARYYLYDNGASDSVQARYDEAIKYLVSVSKGVVSLGVSSSGDKPQTNDCAQMVNDGHVFSRRDNGFV